MANIFEGLLIDHLGDKVVNAYHKDLPNEELETRFTHCIDFVCSVLMLLNVSGQCYLLLASWCAAELGSILSGLPIEVKNSMLNDSYLCDDVKAIVSAWLN